MRSNLLAILLLLLPMPILAAWAEDPLVNVPLSLAPGEKYDVFAVTDGAGGAIVAWEDERAGQSDVYAQRIDVNGDLMWQTDGVPVCTANEDQSLYHSSTSTTGFTPLLPDGEGGVWIAWHDARFFGARGRDVYLQRLDADGEAYFALNGLPIATGSAYEDMPSLCADGAGGVFVVWQDKNDDPIFYNLYGQHVGADGELLWNGGAPLSLVVRDWDQAAPSLCPDGAGGLYLVWQDDRVNLNDIYAQRFDANGQPLWGAGGIAVATSPNGADASVAVAAEGGGVLLAWVDRRTGTPDIYAQKLSPAGAALWTPGGRVVCNATNSQYRPSICGDGAGGLIATWFDFRLAPSGPPWNLNIYAQRVSATGLALWAPNGAPVCEAPDAQRDARLVSDGEGGALVAWEDNRAGTGHEDVYVQHLDASGLPLLAPNGQAMSLAANNQSRPSPIVGAGGVIAAWPDDRALIYDNDVYADRILLDTGGVPAVNRVLFDFGGESEPTSRSFSVSNVGAAALTITAIELEVGESVFALEFEIAPPFALAPGERRSVTVAFDPARMGRAADAVLVHHDAPGHASPLSVNLRSGGVLSGLPGAPVAGIILSAWPNPFNPRTTIEYRLPVATQVSVRIYTSDGRLVRELVNSQSQSAEVHRLQWDGRDGRGHSLSSGQYVLVLDTRAGRSATRLTLIR